MIIAVSLRVNISITPRMETNVPNPATHFQIFLNTVPIKMLCVEAHNIINLLSNVPRDALVRKCCSIH